MSDMKILECEYCKKPIHKGITYEETHIYHPKCYILKDNLTYPILFGGNWKIHAVKFTADKSKNKRTDILLTHKDSGMQFLVYNWKHHPYFHYEVRQKEIDKLFLDGEIKARDVSEFIDKLLPIMEKRLKNE